MKIKQLIVALSFVLFTNKCPAENAGKSISEPINLKNISGGGCPQNPLVCSTYGGPTFLSARTPSKPCVTPLRVSCKSWVQNWLTTLFWCSIFFGCSTVRLTCLIYKQLLIGQVKMDSSGPVPTNKQGLLRTKQIQKFCYWHNHLCHFNYSSLLAIKGHRPRCSRSSAFKLLSRSQ